ncbi:MAG: hypothetical protein ABI855_11585 [Bacteroidota bacterium]
MSVKIHSRDGKFSVSTFFLFLLTTVLLNAQRAAVSPYSRYGVGELQPASFVTQTGMGGIGNATYSNDQLNFINPASYSFDTITCFDAGIRGELSQLKTSSTSHTANGATISYLAFGFPVIKNKWGASLGVMPYSNMGYDIVSSATDAQLGKVNYKFEGDGGLTRFYLGNAYAPFSNLAGKFYKSEKYRKLIADKDSVQIKKHENLFNILKGFSIGCNASWLFGSLNTTRSVEFEEAPTSFNTRIINSTSLGDLYLNFGLLYNYKMKNGKFFNIGLSGAMSSDIRSKFSSYWYNYVSASGVYETVIDTVQYIPDSTGNTTIPLYYSGGIATGKTGKWLIGIDFTMQDWTKFQSPGTNDNLKNSYNVSLGGEWIPNKKGLKFIQKIQYRLGGHYTKTYLTLNNTNINDYGVAFGFGIPVINKDRIQKAIFQLGFEAGQKGTTKNDLLNQQYIRFHFGISLNESWFFKRKYD